jgi:hypothetical protein
VAQVHISDTVLTSAAGVIAVLLVCFGVVLARRSRRYRPGRPFEFTATWLPQTTVLAPETQAEIENSGGTSGRW